MSNFLGLGGYGSDASSVEEEVDDVNTLESTEVQQAECMEKETDKKSEQNLLGFDFPEEADESQVDPETQEKINKFARLIDEEKFNFMRHLRSKKEFANPYLLEKIVNSFGIDDIGSNFRKDVFDPHQYADCEFYEKLAQKQREHLEQKSRNLYSNTSSMTSIEPGYTSKSSSKWGQKPNNLTNLSKEDLQHAVDENKFIPQALDSVEN